MLDLEVHAQCTDHSIVEICTIICDDSSRNTVSTDKILLDESGHNILGDRSKGCCLNPFREVVNVNQDEVVSIGCCRLDLSNHVDSPHSEWPRRC